MARIRSIKPELWSDQKIATLSHSCALFFIGLWNFCDDEGKCENSPKQLSLRMPIFRPENVRLWIGSLSAHGLLQVSSDSAWLRVTNWSHQKIDRPRLPKVKAEDIQWLDVGHSTKPRESSSSIRRKDRIGSDRIGSGSDVVTAPPKAVATPSDLALNSEIWKAYSEAYFMRYGTEPVRNASVNSQIKQIGQRLGKESPDVVRFFVSHNNAFYVRGLHKVGMCLADCESIRTQWATGTTVTNRQAQQADDGATTLSQLQRVREGKL